MRKEKVSRLFFMKKSAFSFFLCHLLIMKLWALRSDADDLWLGNLKNFQHFFNHLKIQCYQALIKRIFHDVDPTFGTSHHKKGFRSLLYRINSLTMSHLNIFYPITPITWDFHGFRSIEIIDFSSNMYILIYLKTFLYF